MEMEDHHNNSNNHYSIDLRHFITGRPSHFPPPPPPPPPPLSVDIFSRNHHHHQQQQLPPHYDMMMLMPLGGSGSGLHDFHSDSTSAAACVAPPAQPHQQPSLLPPSTSVAAAGCSTPSALCPLEADAGSFGGIDGGTGRWPRQETLTLLEVRSRLDSKFKEANQKGPLWDEVSRIMSDEHGYQRSGKKCREKFENLYKYYKKTKEGKAGRQDGKHYRFFRQLEALYGETSNPLSGIPESRFGGSSVRFPSGFTSCIQAPHDNNFHSSLSLSNSSGFDTCSSEDIDHDLSTATLQENDSSEKRRKRRSWKAKIKEFIDFQMRKLIEKQESWLERLTKTLEQKEQERMIREEEWRNQEAARAEKEQRFWAKERAWIEARDAALMDTLRKLTGTESSPERRIIRTESPNEISNESINWDDSEIARLVQFRSNLESRFQQCGCIEEEESLWKEIARKMRCEKNPLMCKEKWDSISNYDRKTKEIINNNKKRKENSNSNSCYYQSNYTYCEEQGDHQETANTSTNQENAAVNENCFPFLMSDGGGDNLWDNYGLKLSKGN